jgi:hypothetical protein
MSPPSRWRQLATYRDIALIAMAGGVIIYTAGLLISAPLVDHFRVYLWAVLTLAFVVWLEAALRLGGPPRAEDNND